MKNNVNSEGGNEEEELEEDEDDDFNSTFPRNKSYNISFSKSLNKHY